jgi:hypothetical protein
VGAAVGEEWRDGGLDADLGSEVVKEGAGGTAMPGVDAEGCTGTFMGNSRSG